MPLFLSPLFLFGTLAAAVPIVLHLLKREQEPRVKFAAVALLRHAPVERSSTRRLREILLLMLRVSALLVLALAFARPFFPSPAAAAASRNATVVLLDTSYSMSSPGRFARAQQLARDAVNRAPAGDDVGVVMFGDRAELVAAPSSSRAAALAAIDAAVAGAGGTRYLAAVNAAGRALGSRRGTVVVVTDLQAGGWDAGDHASVPESTRVEVQDVGALPDNLAVVGLRSEGDRVVVTVRNDSQRARDVAVRLSVDGRMAGERSAPVAPHGTADVVFSAVSGGEAAASVDDRDGLQADNVRYARLTGTSRSAVLVVTATGDLDRDAFYVHQALVAGGTARAGGASGVTGVAAGQLGSWTSAQTAGFASVLLLSTRGLDRRGRELIASYVAAGGGLLIAVGQDVDGDVAADVLGAAAKLRVQAPDDRPAPQPLSLAPADIRHPIFQPFGPAAASLGLVRFERVAAISASGCQTLAKFTSGEAAVIDCGIGEGHALVVSSDLNNRWNDFPLHASFLPFMHETVRYLSRGRAQATEYLVGEAPAGAVPVPGIVTLGAAGAPSRRVVINVDPVESEPARISPAEFESAIARLKDAGAAETRTAASNRESGQRVWQYLLGAMMVLLAVEGAVAARTV